ncbi:MAG: epoxyqueuosine reductase [Negativicutes bacterium]|nr:epoxyqueuosine reductase [Negativicutes bacterium]
MRILFLVRIQQLMGVAVLLLEDIIQATTRFAEESSLNLAKDLNDLQIFDPPLLAVAAADDPLFESLKEEDAVGPQHLSPNQWLPGSRAVVSYFLPFTQPVRKANRTMGLAAVEWLYGRIEGEMFNNGLRRFLAEYFTAAGFQAIVPPHDPRFKVVSRRSNWSERHVAFIAGLGTFSLSRSMITKAGSAGRFGSVIVNADLVATPRYYSEREENCSKCGACIPRCPPLAITEAGKDNAVCSDFLDRVKIRFEPRYGCGKCQAGVPCESGIPVKKHS